MELSISILLVIFMDSLIQFNGNVLCQGQSYPLERGTNSTQKLTNIYIKSGYFFSKKDTNASTSVNQCGLKNFDRGEGDFPWHAIILEKQRHVSGTFVLYFSCNGNLISSRHVLTTSYCLRSNGKALSNDELFIVLGKDDIEQNTHAQSSRKYEAKSIAIHPDYAELSGDADIGVITLSEEVQFKTFIRPICLWSGDLDLMEIEGGIGAVTGWRIYGVGPKSESPIKQVGLSIVSREQCLLSRSDVDVISERTFCASPSLKDRDIPCSGSIGSGFMTERSGRWMLRGIVSKWIPDQEDACDSSQYMVFTDISKFSSWILSFINK